jgi:translation initiation factor IF-3
MKMKREYKIVCDESLKEEHIATKDAKFRINDEIQAKEVRVITDDGEQFGVLSLADAIKKAEEMSVDLVELSPDASPPVCKLIDYGKFLYQKEKKDKEARKKQKIVELKEMKFRPKIDDHDFDYRIKQIREFLDEGDKVKITIRFRGRELVHAQLGFDLIEKIVAQFQDLALPEKKAKLEGKSITLVLAPNIKK